MQQDQKESLKLDWNLPTLKYHKFEEVLAQAEEEHNLDLAPIPFSAIERGIPKDIADPGDDCVHLSKLLFRQNGIVEVPHLGLMEMSGWSKRQLRTITGVDVDKFFSESNERDITDTMQRHLSPHKDNPNYVVKVVARSHHPDIARTQSSDGVIRGFVGRNYSRITDYDVLDVMSTSVNKKLLDDLRFVGNPFEENGSTFMMLYGDMLNIEEVDDQRFGLRMRNSDVGARSLSIVSWMLRLICTNGLTTGIGEYLLRKRHSHLDQLKMGAAMRSAFTEALEKKNDIVSTLKIAMAAKVDDVEPIINANLLGFPRYVAEAAREAYQKEPIPSVYGAAQAVARAGVALRRNRELQVRLEGVAGKIMKSAQRLEA